MKKKRYTMELKKKIVKEALHNGNVSEVARNYGLVPRTVRSWVKQYKMKGDLWEKTGDKAKKVSLDQQDVSHKTIIELREQIYQLKEQLRKQKEGDQLRIGILEDLVKKRNLCPQNRIEVAECWMRKGYSQNKTMDIINVSKYAYRKYRENQEEVSRDGEKKVVRIHSRKRKGKGNIPGYALDGKGRRISDERVMDIVLSQITENKFDAYGYRKLAYKIRKRNYIIFNHKKMYRLCRESGLLRHRGKKRCSSLSTNRAYEREVTASNQLWEMDIQHKRLADHTMVQILSIIDVFDRVTVFSQGYLSCKSRDVMEAVQRALKKYVGKGEENPVIRTDNGSQFVSHEFHKFMETIGIYHERIPNKSPNHNAHIESYHSIVRNNFLDRFEFRNFEEFRKEHASFAKHYNGEYYHGSLGYLASHEYRKTMRNSQTQDPTRIVKVI